MRRLSVVPGALRACLVLLAAALPIACTPKERAPDSARAAVDSTAKATPAPGTSAAPLASSGHASPADSSLPGALSKPIDQYSGDELYAFVQHLKWGGGADRDRRCKDHPSCEGSNPSAHTVVHVDAVDGQDSISALKLPANGVVGIRAVNRGAHIDGRYGFKPDKKLEYYLIVLPGDAKAGKWQLEELDTTPGARRHSRVSAGTFTPCNHPFKPGPVNRANFYTCADSHMSDSVQKSGLVMFSAPNSDPLWMYCAQGCCMADG